MEMHFWAHKNGKNMIYFEVIHLFIRCFSSIFKRKKTILFSSKSINCSFLGLLKMLPTGTRTAIIA